MGIAHELSSYAPKIPPYSGNPNMEQLKKGSFGIVAGSLGFSVVVFCCCALICIAGLYLRRFQFGYELGGAYKMQTGAFFIVLWFVYVILSILESGGTISANL